MVEFPCVVGSLSSVPGALLQTGGTFAVNGRLLGHWRVQATLRSRIDSK